MPDIPGKAIGAAARKPPYSSEAVQLLRDYRCPYCTTSTLEGKGAGRGAKAVYRVRRDIRDSKAARLDCEDLGNVRVGRRLADGKSDSVADGLERYAWQDVTHPQPATWPTMGGELVMVEKPVQLDLFGEVEKAEQDDRDRAQAASAWAARFERADWIAPWDTAGGMKIGDRVLGWRCPDPDCGQIAPNTTLLANDHGWDPRVPGREPFDGRCHRLRLMAAHRAYEARQQGKEPPEGPR